VQLNVRGVTAGFTVPLALLVSVPDSALATMFSERNKPMLIVINGNQVFVDRDPEVFIAVLEYLRNGCILNSFKSFRIRDLFLKELEFWNLPAPGGIVDCNDDVLELNVSGETAGF
jgi:hypothetical protein